MFDYSQALAQSNRLSEELSRTEAELEITGKEVSGAAVPLKAATEVRSRVAFL